jgi:hypothetical protein
MRTDSVPKPIFGKIKLSAGVAIVIRDLSRVAEDFRFSNRSYSDKSIIVRRKSWQLLTNDPDFTFAVKLHGPKLKDRVLSKPFGIEANFGVRNRSKISDNKSDWTDPVRIFVNDKEGSGGRMEAKWTERSSVPKRIDLIDDYKVVVTSAFPRKSVVNGLPTSANVASRLAELLKIIDPPAATSRTRLVLLHSKSRLDCENFLKYSQTRFFAYLMTVEPNKSAMIGFVIPDQDFSAQSDIDWTKPTKEIDKQLFKKYNLSKDEIKLIMTRP